MSSLASGSLFPKELVTDLFSKVSGHSSVAKLAGQTPMPFSGIDVMTFSLDTDVAIVAEGAAKPAGDATVATVSIRPIKVVYQSRVNDEFMRCAEEKKLQYLQAFVDGYAKKIARGLDIMVFHGLDPKTSTTSSVIGANCLDRASSVALEAYSSAAVEGDVDNGSLMAGQAVGLMDKITPISDLVVELLTDANNELIAVKRKLG